MINKILIFIMCLICFAAADLKNAAEIRRGNGALRGGDLEYAKEVYDKLPNSNGKIAFNKGFLYFLLGDEEQADNYYQMVLGNRKVSKKDQAKVYLNKGNQLFIKGKFKEAVKEYRQGLLLDPKNKRLKYNLELANNAKLAQKVQQQQQQQQGEGSENEEKKEQQGAEKDQQEKDAEKILDAFKNEEQENMQKAMQQGAEKHNVEKDW